VATTGLTWLSLQPLLKSTFPTAQLLSVSLVVLDAVASTGLAFLILNRAVYGAFQKKKQLTDESLARVGLPVSVGDDWLEKAIERFAQALMQERDVRDKRYRELVETVEQRSRLEAELVATDRLATVGKLASGVAHEVGNPLSGILGYLSVLRSRSAGNASVNEVIERIEGEVQRIDGIVRALLEMGRPSRGKAALVELKPIVEACIRLVKASSQSSSTTQLICEPNLQARAEPGPLSQVLVNLLMNANQATRGEGAIRVTVSTSASSATIEVEDDGPGLPPEVLPKLFTPFFTTKPPGQGTGLGLAVSRHLLAQFDGKLEAFHGASGGARFVVTLPAG
jgi:signal transduction histidine kinase